MIKTLVAYFFMLPFLFGCASGVPEAERARSPVVNQILRARGGRLSNAACNHLNEKECVADLVVYDLEDAQIRKLLNNSKFFCDAAGRKFHICPNTPALCRKSEPVVTKKFLWFRIKTEYPEELIFQGPKFDQLSVTCRSILRNR